jgi:hypothetical protein
MHGIRANAKLVMHGLCEKLPESAACVCISSMQMRASLRYMLFGSMYYLRKTQRFHVSSEALIVRTKMRECGTFCAYKKM